MTTTERPIRFDPELLDRLDRRSRESGEDLSRLVNVAVARYLADDPAGGDDAPPRAGRRMAAWAEAYREALLARDAGRAREVVERATAAGADVLDLYVEVLAPAMADVGHLWALDRITVAQEHFATEVTVQVLAALASDRRLPPTQGRLAIVCCSPDEHHALGSRMVADVVQRAGWEVIGLGAATPPDDLVALAGDECPDLVALSTSTAGRLPGVQEVLGRLAALSPRPFVVVGGPLYTAAVAAVARSWGADLVTSDLRTLLRAMRERFPPA